MERILNNRPRRFIPFILLCFFAISRAGAGSKDPDKKVITVAFIFPFHASKVYIADLSESKFNFPEETQIAIEYLQGALLAIDSLKATGLHARILVFDCGNDSVAIARILQKPDLRNADLIFAPFNGYALNAVARFGLQEEIPVISPLAVSVKDSVPNPFLILANASMNTHVKAVYEYMQEKALFHRSLMLYQKKQADLAAVNGLKNYLDEKKAAGKSVVKFIELTDSSKTTYWKLKDSLFRTDVNHIFIASTNEPFVRAMLKQIYTLKDDYRFAVYGMPTWSGFSLIPQEHFDSLNVTISESFWIDKTAPLSEQFKASYHRKYEVDPSAYSVRGFDAALYFIAKLRDSDSLNVHLRQASPSKQLATVYNYRAAAPGNSPSSLENHGVILLQRKDGAWIPVPE
jgi:ABC-type branched-subunit amino acid transport system substrate-binding protein